MAGEIVGLFRCKRANVDKHREAKNDILAWMLDKGKREKNCSDASDKHGGVWELGLRRRRNWMTVHSSAMNTKQYCALCAYIMLMLNNPSQML